MRMSFAASASASRLGLALVAGGALVLTGSGAAHATRTVEVPAAVPGGISASVKVHGAVVPQPYDPDPTAYYGPRACVLKYHHYYATEGCGGFSLDVVLHDVQGSPGFKAGLWSTDDRFQAHADTARTFRCVRPDGGSERADDVVVRTVRTALAHNYFYADANRIVSELRKGAADLGPQLYLNFPPEQINCPAGTTASQYGLKITNLKVSINDENDVFGTTTWAYPGAIYA
ncbi:hypothetical protein [Streptomyces sp. NBC_01565]|uniref:hypothetical protein n=1 Tax=unclassified Streptomyces TaxID=2593676 RepID=UPI0022569EAB|nr:hypothetical protein [Streptomyces sp. NBC_01565]MCX4545168.1 hypothetical protein [Streptomyces sp. NBC_01565]